MPPLKIFLMLSTVFFCPPACHDRPDSPPPLVPRGADPAAAAAGVQQIVAHRGARVERPECTLAAIRRAIEVGATAVEADVRTSRDGQLFLLHDATLDRTTNGIGPAANLTIAELKSLDAGSWFDPKYHQERIPTLGEAVEVCRGKIDILLDLKEKGTPYAHAVADIVQKRGDPARTILGVRSVEQAREFRNLLPTSRQLGLIPNPQSIEDFAKAGVETIRLWPKWLTDKSLVQRLRKSGSRLYLSTGKGTLAETLPLLAHAPYALSSDDPARLIKTLAQIKQDK